MITINNFEAKLVDEPFDKNDDSNYLMIADFERRVVRTNCGDFYYDYGISFYDFTKFAHFIENEEKRLKSKI